METDLDTRGGVPGDSACGRSGWVSGLGPSGQWTEFKLMGRRKLSLDGNAEEASVPGAQAGGGWSSVSRKGY